MTWNLAALRNSVFGSSPAVALEQLLIKGQDKATAAGSAVKESATSVVAGVKAVGTAATSGLRMGIIAAAVILALYVVANLNLLIPRRN